jgi:hypothetical protein
MFLWCVGFPLLLVFFVGFLATLFTGPVRVFLLLMWWPLVSTTCIGALGFVYTLISMARDPSAFNADGTWK